MLSSYVIFFLKGGDLPSVTDICRPRLYLLQWLKSDKALMMLFNDGTFQVCISHYLSAMSPKPCSNL